MKRRSPFRGRTPWWCWVAVGMIALLVLPGAAPMCGQDEEDAASSVRDQRQLADHAFLRGDWEAAWKSYRDVVAASPQDGRSWFRYGYALHADGRIEEALEAHRQAATFPQARPTATYNWACALALLGRGEEALAKLEEAIDSGFRSPRPIQNDPDFVSLVDREEFRALAARALDEEVASVYRQFDFWVGSWDVVGKDGKILGTNVISKDEQGYLLTEKWRGANGTSGTSINFYDPAAKKWKQTWVDARGNIIRYEGEYRDGKMQFSGESVDPSGDLELSRMTFTPMPDGRVRQYIERSADEGQTWSVFFDGYYVTQAANREEAP